LLLPNHLAAGGNGNLPPIVYNDQVAFILKMGINNPEKTKNNTNIADSHEKG
jgi:hypothetical protein